MEDKFLKGATKFMKDFVRGVDDDVLKRRHQAAVTFTSVQFSGAAQMTKLYQPGKGYLTNAETGNEKITDKNRPGFLDSVDFSGRLGMAGENQYHWRSYSTHTARTLLDQLEVTKGKGSLFESEVAGKILGQPLNGNSQLFLCLQDIAIAKQTNSGFYKNVSAKMTKYTNVAPKRVLIVLSDDRAFDNNELNDLAIFGEKSDNLDALAKKKKIMEMTARNFEELYFVAFKTSDKNDIKGTMSKLMPSAVDNVFAVDDNETQLQMAKTIIFEKLGL